MCVRPLAVVAVAALVLLAGCGGADDSGALGPVMSVESPEASPSLSPTASAIPSVVPSATPVRTVTPTPTKTRSAPTTKPPEKPRKPSPTPTRKPPPPPEPPEPDPEPEPEPSSDIAVYGRSELIVELNERRAALDLKPVTFRASTADKAEACATKNLREGTFEHCGYEALFAGTGSKRWSVKTMLDTWFDSPPHRRMLVDPKVKFAGGAAVVKGNRTVAAIALDFE
ncbi:CAP domain-containing protein [Tenggerimyces flavus]|uniref:CAP domain-containing protein n=1 Tax=Tenggerimyces flavus TaxID=1708749 RepID=A0ABV7Y7W4_9ACTN|nr:CAP domain-containing protein [Tenggerimyces flavus]MBM7785336.1 uncharacterized protein YkwD [Tenggerimyces flavus]